MTTHAAAHAKQAKKPRSPRPNPYAVCQVVNKTVLVNAYAATIHECPTCRITEYRSGLIMRVSYAHKQTRSKHCDECELDRIALVGAALEMQGIPLGWGVRDHSKEYEREAYRYDAEKVEGLGVRKV